MRTFKIIVSVLMLSAFSTFAQDECKYEPNIPAALNIDGDGVDDHFIIEWDCAPEVFEIHIYNRWGNEVFTSKTTAFKWDGNDPKGNPVIDAVLFVVLTYEAFGQEKTKKTNIALNR
ncbi:MAG: flagellar hook assembly protein FlgD [Arenicella sp.]|jgi:flagellar hook assembly protein FlgD